MNIIRKKDIIITGIQDWNIKIGSNCKNIALEFSKHNRVLYVNPPKDRFTKLKAMLKGDKNKVSGVEKISHVGENLWVLTPAITIESINHIPFSSLFDALNRYNNRLFAKEIKKGIAQLGFKNFIHFCDSDMFRSFYLKELLHPDLFIYYSRDNLLAVDYWKKYGSKYEPLLMKKSGLVLTNSEYLAELGRKHAEQSYFVGQGCDLKAFNPKKVTIPADVDSIQKPRIGYIGSLNSLRLNIELLVNIAKKRSDWNFVLVGPEDDNFKKSALHELSNVYFLGSKPEDSLPSYLASFDVAINPQIVNEVTIGNYPRKIDEYLAMGIPTVATYTKAMQYFAGYVSLAVNQDEWIMAIEKELKMQNKDIAEKRMAFASEHTWEKNVSEIYSRIYDYMEPAGMESVI